MLRTRAIPKGARGTHAVKHSAKLTKCIVVGFQSYKLNRYVRQYTTMQAKACEHTSTIMADAAAKNTWMLQDISRLRNFDAALHKDIQSAGCEQYYDSEEPDRNRACLRLFERGFAIKDMTGALRQGFQGFPGSALIPHGVARGTYSTTLLHIVGLAPRAPVAVRIKPMRVYTLAHTSPALPSPLIEYNAAGATHPARASNTSRSAS